MDNILLGIRALGLAGLLVSAYALYVERQIESDPMYVPSCNTRWGSCVAVFRSSYAHLLSHWGLVQKGDPLDLSLASAGMLNYGVYILYTTPLVQSFTKRHIALIYLSSASVVFSLYLLYILKFVLRDFCIVCTTFHIINFAMFGLCCIEYKRVAGSTIRPEHEKLR